MKAKELREMTMEELELKKKEITEEYFKARIKHSLGQFEKTGQLRIFRRDIARINTFLSQKRLSGVKQGG